VVAVSFSHPSQCPMQCPVLRPVPIPLSLLLETTVHLRRQSGIWASNSPCHFSDPSVPCSVPCPSHDSLSVASHAVSRAVSRALLLLLLLDTTVHLGGQSGTRASNSPLPFLPSLTISHAPPSIAVARCNYSRCTVPLWAIPEMAHFLVLLPLPVPSPLYPVLFSLLPRPYLLSVISTCRFL
jgi:hypothetical protein